MILDTNAIYRAEGHELLRGAVSELIKLNGNHDDLVINWYLKEVVKNEREQQQLRELARKCIPPVERLERICGISLGVPHVEFPDHTAMNQAEQHLRQIDREWNEAYPNRDIEALNRIIADDWKCIDGTGRVISKQQLLERVSANSNPFSSHEFDEFDLRMFGDTAIVTGRLSGRGRNDSGDFSLEQRYTRVYIRRAGVWRAIATQVTVVSTQQ